MISFWNSRAVCRSVAAVRLIETASPLLLPTAPRMRPIGPKTMGKKRKARMPKTIPAIEKPLPVAATGGAAAGLGA